MADYKELLRKAVQALPENNGASRRAVYEKARSALVGQLRAINPPLAARDITAHRLQLEDCIRQVEQEASEAVIAGMQESIPRQEPLTQAPKLEARPQGRPQPVPVETPAEPNSIEDIIAAAEAALPQTKPPAKPAVVASKPAGKAAAGGAKTRAKPVLAPVPDTEPEPIPVFKLEPRPEPPKLEPRAEARQQESKQPEPKVASKANGKTQRPLPSIVARAEAAKKQTTVPPTVFGIPPEKPYDSGRRGPVIETRRETTMPPRLDPGSRTQVAARQVAEPVSFDEPQISAAMSAVREVEVEHQVDPQGAIDRAIATLDREARGEAPVDGAEPKVNGKDVRANGKVVEMPLPVAKSERTVPPTAVAASGMSAFDRPEKPAKPDRSERRDAFERDRKRPRRDAPPRGRERADGAFQREQERGGVSALTIFLGVFAILLIGVGGAGVWAWQEGYLNLDTMFARGEPTQQEAVAPQVNLAPATPSTAVSEATAVAAATPAPAPQAAPDARLAADTPAVAAVEPLALMPPAGQQPAATEERLPVGDQTTEPGTTGTTVASLDPAAQSGSQSLLLEASEDGSTGAVPFSGSVDWSKGTDETGLPMIVGKASIPARNLGIDVLIRKNADASLPASHLMEITFSVSDTFIGGSIAHLPGVLLKNEELVQGTPLQGASARVVGNSFLFALSATAEDSASNYDLLTSRKWIDLAIIYATGKRAIVTLEKDDAAEKLFRDVFASWGPAPTASAQ